MEHEVGLLCGRFQPVHKGHIEVAKEALRHCEHLIIAIGSAQESGTKKNPFSYETRRELLYLALWSENTRITIIPINDRAQIVDDGSWGKYLIKEVTEQTGMTPTINFSGEEEIRSHWFDEVDIDEVEINRNIVPISATKIREALLNGKQQDFMNMMPEALWSQYEYLRDKVREIYNE